MKFSQEFIQKIKDRVSLSEIMGKYVRLIPAGNMRFKGLCPFHNEKTPSFVVSDDKANYHCFGCGVHGDVISFLEEKEGYNFSDAVTYLANHAGISLPKNDYDNKAWAAENNELSMINGFANFFVSSYKGSAAEKYVKNRNIPDIVVQEFGLGYAPHRSDIDKYKNTQNFQGSTLENIGLYRKGERGSYFFLSDRLTFPIHNHSGKIVAFGGRILGEGQPKYINSPEHKFFKKRELLYNYFRAKQAIQKSGEVIVCEGYMDVIAMHMAGFKNVVAPLGTAFSEMHLEILWKAVDNPTICLDGDEAGRKAMRRIADIALPHLKPGKSLSFVLLPEGKDPDDVLNYGGQTAMQALLDDKLFLAEMFVRDICTENLNTPESRSAAGEKLKQIAAKIENESVRSQYSRYFKDAFYKFYKDKSYRFTKQSKTNLTISNSDAPVEEVEILIFIILFPNSLAEEKIEEQFSMLEFSNPMLTKVQEYILQNIGNLNLENVKLWLLKNISGNIGKFMLKKIDIACSIQSDGQDLGFRFEYLYQGMVLASLKRDYQSNIRSHDESKQKLAIQLKHDIKMLENKLNNYLTS